MSLILGQLAWCSMVLHQQKAVSLLFDFEATDYFIETMKSHIGLNLAQYQICISVCLVWWLLKPHSVRIFFFFLQLVSKICSLPSPLSSVSVVVWTSMVHQYVAASLPGMFLTGLRKWKCCVNAFNKGMMPLICFPAIPCKRLTREIGKQSWIWRLKGTKERGTLYLGFQPQC